MIDRYEGYMVLSDGTVVNFVGTMDECNKVSEGFRTENVFVAKIVLRRIDDE